MYNIQINSNEKIFLIKMEGFVSKEEGFKMTTEMNQKMKTFNTKDYYVVIDTQELKVSGQDSLDQMKSTIALFTSGIFKGAYNIASKNLVTNMQANRVGKDVGFSKIIQVNSYEEAVKSIRALN